MLQRLVSEERSFESTYKTLCDNLVVEMLYGSSSFESHEWNEEYGMTHKQGFINNIVDTFLKIHANSTCRRITDVAMGDYVRFRLRKLVQFVGQ